MTTVRIISWLDMLDDERRCCRMVATIELAAQIGTLQAQTSRTETETLHHSQSTEKIIST